MIQREFHHRRSSKRSWSFNSLLLEGETKVIFTHWNKSVGFTRRLPWLFLSLHLPLIEFSKQGHAHPLVVVEKHSGKWRKYLNQIFLVDTEHMGIKLSVRQWVFMFCYLSVTRCLQSQVGLRHWNHYPQCNTDRQRHISSPREERTAGFVAVWYFSKLVTGCFCDCQSKI